MKFLICSVFFFATSQFYCKDTIGQSTMTFFKDTATRIGSSISSVLYDNDGFIYQLGDGTSRTSLKAAQVRKIDSAGNEIWSTANTKLFSQGYISSAFADSNFIFAFGIIKNLYQPSTFFLGKIDKSNGHVYYKINNAISNGYGIIDVKDKGNDSIRIVSFTYDQGQANFNGYPIITYCINKFTGNSSAPIPYGLSDIAPMYIDSNDIVYYYTSTDSLIKYDVNQKIVLWGNREYWPQTYSYKTATNIKKEGSKIYLFGDRYCRQIDNATGVTGWNTRISSWLYQEFWPSDICIKDDSIYTAWVNPFYGGNDIYGHFTKINKTNGALYLNGTISDSGAISYYSTGYFKPSKVLVNSSNDFYLFGWYLNDITGQRVVKKFAWNGILLSEKKLSVDSISWLSYNNLIPGSDPGFVTGFMKNNQPHFIYNRYIHILNQQESSSRICFTSLDSTLSIKTEKFYDNNSYQYPSTVVDIKKHDNFVYLLKKQGWNIYLEKLYKTDSLIWRQDLSANCYFTPVTMAIDSTGVICVIGNSQNCATNSDQYNLTTGTPINRTIYINPNGNILSSLEISTFYTNSKLANLLGIENGFILVGEKGIVKLSPSGVFEDLVIMSNFSYGLSNANSKNIFLTFNTADSIYIFSSRVTNTTNAFYHAVDKQTFQVRKTFLTDHFPQGYLLHAVKSSIDSNLAYISGLTGQGGYPTIIKFNYKTGAVTWKYSGNFIGEAYKVVEDSLGFVYALLKKDDSTKFIKLDPFNGNILWQYSKFEPDRFSRSIDMDINNVTKTLVAAGFNYITPYYKPYVISLDTQTGNMLDLQILQGDFSEPNLIHAVESMSNSTVLIGGNLNSEMLYGKYGILLTKGPSDEVICSNNYWLGTISNNWENPGNWSCGIVPGPSSNVYINSGNIVISSNVTINTLEIGSGSILTINNGYNLLVLN